jgi:hypothetical protein
MMVRGDERMTTESESKGKEAAKELNSFRIPARIGAVNRNLLSLRSTTRSKMSHACSGAKQLGQII